MGRKADRVLKAQAKDFIKEKKGYTTKEEKKAYRIAIRQRKKAWLKALEAMEPQQQKAERKRARRFWAMVYKKQLLIAGAAVLLLLALLLLIIIL